MRLSGDFTGSGLVAADGRWSIKVADQPVFGKVSVTAVLTAPGQTDSPSVSSSYTVMPPVPAVSGIRDGKHLRQDALPATISGTAVDGAEVSVAVDGVAIGSAQAGSGGAAARAALQPRVPQNLAGGARWSVPFPAGLAAGAHTLTVTQAVDAVVSLPAAVAFTVDAAPASGGAPGGTTAPSQPTDPSQPTGQQPAQQSPDRPSNRHPRPSAGPERPAQPAASGAGSRPVVGRPAIRHSRPVGQHGRRRAVALRRPRRRCPAAWRGLRGLRPAPGGPLAGGVQARVRRKVAGSPYGYGDPRRSPATPGFGAEPRAAVTGSRPARGPGRTPRIECLWPVRHRQSTRSGPTSGTAGDRRGSTRRRRGVPPR